LGKKSHANEVIPLLVVFPHDKGDFEHNSEYYESDKYI
jgi:hypothetical protein